MYPINLFGDLRDKPPRTSTSTPSPATTSTLTKNKSPPCLPSLFGNSQSSDEIPEPDPNEAPRKIAYMKTLTATISKHPRPLPKGAYNPNPTLNDHIPPDPTVHLTSTTIHHISTPKACCCVEHRHSTKPCSHHICCRPRRDDRYLCRRGLERTWVPCGFEGPNWGERSRSDRRMECAICGRCYLSCGHDRRDPPVAEGRWNLPVVGKRMGAARGQPQGWLDVY